MSQCANEYDKDNPPGRSQVHFRAGTWAELRERGIEQLAQHTLTDASGTPRLDDNGNEVRPLAELTTRSGDDPSIALLDGFAAMGDVLTFYSERVANEGYLRTATERRSVLELARAIGYELSPGVAASVLLAFTVETASGSPTQATVPVGTAVKSIPGEGELPQTFETVEGIEARPEWNAIPLRQSRPQILGLRDDGGAPALHLYEFDGSLGGVTGAVTIAAPGANPVWRDNEFLLADDDIFEAMAASPWGVRAIPIPSIYVEGKAEIEDGDRLLLVGRSYENAQGAGKRKFKTLIRIAKDVTYDSEHDRTRIRLDAGTLPSYGLQIFYVAVTLGRMLGGAGVITESGLNFMMTAGTLSIGKTGAPLPPAAADIGLFAFRESLSFFGHNAPKWDTLPAFKETERREPAKANDPYKNSWEAAMIWETSQGDLYTIKGHRADVYLERAVKNVGIGSWIVVEDDAGTRKPYRVAGTLERSLSDYALNGKTTGLVLQDDQGEALQDVDKTEFGVRKTTGHVASERRGLADLPIEDDVDPVSDRLLLDGLVQGLSVGRPVVVSGESRLRPGVTTSRVLRIAQIQHVISKIENGQAVGGFTSLQFKTGVGVPWVRSSVRVHANVVLATHGETTEQMLGDGDGTKIRQQFALTGLPLTYVSSTTPNGRETTLEVRVNDVLWKEADTLLELGPNEARYVVRHEDDGTTTVEFGDGVSAARLPSGLQNVRAKYRKGIGLEGEVAAESLTLLARRPLGIRGVTNPLPASGAADQEQLDDARQNAPLRVLTFDRIVSLRDYEDAAHGFAGIGKARADTLWQGEQEVVHVTVAAASGRPVDDLLLKNLRDAIAAAHDPSTGFIVSNFRERLFSVHALLLIDERYESEKVIESATLALWNAYSFSRRSFGAHVTAAEIIALLDGVAGVIAVDLESLSSGTTSSRVYLDADAAQATPGGFLGAELLLINSAGIELEEKER